MTAPTLEWYREQSEHNRRLYEILQAAWPDDFHDWKVIALFYSALHRINYWLVKQTGRAPKNHFRRNQQVKHELPTVFRNYRDLFTMSIRARYRDGRRTRDYYHSRALTLLKQLEQELPFA